MSEYFCTTDGCNVDDLKSCEETNSCGRFEKMLSSRNLKSDKYTESQITNRLFVKNLPIPKLDILICNKLIEGNIINFVMTLIKPKNSREGMFYDKLNLKDYTSKIMGKSFVNSLSTSITTIPEDFNKKTRNWLESNFVEDFATKPKWVTFNDDEDSHSFSEIKLWESGPSDKSENSDNEVFSFQETIRESQVYYGDEETDKYLDTQYPKSNLEVEYSFVDSEKKSPKRDISLMGTVSPSRVFGPLNSFIDSECMGGPLDGCRMLSCTCLTEGEKWFVGSCDYCNKKIRNISRAVRYPNEEGGWVGSYCSFDCLSFYDEADLDVIEELRDSLLNEGIMDRY